jgi:D-lactate dehydrogenase
MVNTLAASLAEVHAMRFTVFSTKAYDRPSLTAAGRAAGHEPVFIEPRLDPTTARLAVDSTAVCLFVNDVADAATLAILAEVGVRGIALRCAGFNQIDRTAAHSMGLSVARVPTYAPNAIAEHAVGLMLMLNRNLHRAHNRIREGNFSLAGLTGFNLAGKTVAIIGTGAIGTVTARIMLGFGCNVVAFDQRPNPELLAAGVRYMDLPSVLAKADIVSLHVPLNASTQHLMDRTAISHCKPGVMLINTSRGGLLDTAAAIDALKQGHIGSLGLDVYEYEGALFFEDRSDRPITDDLFSRLITFPNVVITGHQAFLTREALHEIAQTTIGNLNAFAAGTSSPNDL